jgi:hypothetical protein
MSMFKFFPAVSKTAWTVYHATRAYVNCQFFLYFLVCLFGQECQVNMSIIHCQPAISARFCAPAFCDSFVSLSQANFLVKQFFYKILLDF